MSKKIILKKATRIEGNANIHLEVEEGRITSARFMVMDFRGFEKFVQGKQAESAPHIVSRICGLCCTAHQVAGYRAVESALGVQAPDEVNSLREIALLGETIASHALSLFFLTMPDQLGVSNGIFELMQSQPEMAARAFSLRKAGNRIVEILCKRAVHPVAMGIGSFLTAPTPADIKELRAIAQQIRDAAKRGMEHLEFRSGQPHVIGFPKDQQINFFTFDDTDREALFKTFDQNGKLRFSFSPDSFEDNIAEVRVDWSFAKLPYLSSIGFPDGIVLVGPLSRLFRKNGVLSDPDLSGFRVAERLRDAASLSIDDFDLCRGFEIFCSAKKILSLLDGLDLSRPLKVDFDPAISGKGIGVVEAPRGVLVHSYTINRGLIESMKLYVATQFNNAFINSAIKDLAGGAIEGDNISDAGQEMIARCVRLFDPCLTCATH